MSGAAIINGLKFLGKGAFKTLELVIKNPGKTATAGALYGGWKALGGFELGKTLEKEGGIGVLRKAVQGDKAKDQSVGGQVLDTVVGNDNIEKAKDAVSKKVDEVSDAVKGAVSSGSDGNYPMHPEATGAVTSDFSNIFDLVGSFFNGRGLGIGAMIAGAFMMFGRMGWLGKIAGLLTMALGYKGISNYNETQRLQQQVRQTEQERRQPTQQRTASEIYDENRENTNENVIINRQR